jgi:5-methyltetrahydrofolate--homocysteine methyltransferase
MAARPSILDELRQRVVVADGAMGTMLQAADPTLDDYQGYEGCNEILNVTLPDVVRGVHAAYFEAGADAVETNTFGANLANLGEYDIADRIMSCRSPARRSPARSPTASRHPTARAGSSGRWARGPSSRPCCTCPTRPCATPTRPTPPA